ncbi:McrB family protein [Campylobacter concisus]|jgi:thiamine-phosphate diphosphorylase|uniref:McrB family protein n=1 Tax=Campylobacter concisus TaxID=199 RepID=UPI00122CCCA1|nr:AAA family ATPase [Campylobacter concisus]
MTNFTAEQIIKINEIFSRVVDCKGNLKVFNGAWDKYKNYTAIYEEDSNGNKSIQATYSTKVSLEDIYNNAKKALSICNVGNIVDINIVTIKTFDISSKVSKAKIGDQADAHFSVLLHQCPDLKEEDFNTLYNAFYDVLAICGYDFNSSDNHTILYLNIFQRLIDYFKDGKIKFDVKSGTVGQIDSGLIEKLKECYEINKFVCKIKLFIKENYTPLKSLEIDWDKFKNNLDDINKELFDRNSGIWRQVGKIAGAFYGLTKNDLKNIIYYGAPGTGKTKFVKYCLDILDPNRTRTEWVQFHSGFEYEDFIDGIKPIGIQNGNLNLALTNGIFKEFCLKAAQNTDENFFFIVDEINRADIAAVFGETLSLLEENYRGKSSAIKIKNSALMEDIIVSDASKKSLCIDYGNLQTKFYIPANIYFIGMMNDVDKSIDCFDLALRRRFAWVLMECDYEVVENATDKAYKTKCESLNNYITNELKYLVEYEDETRVKIRSIQSYNNAENRDDDYNKLFSDASDKEKDKKRYEKTSGLNLGRAYEIGHSYFLKKETTDEKEIWARHIEPILREYIRTQFGDGEVEKKLKMAKKIFVG